MKIKVIDNFIDPDLIEILQERFLYETPHEYGHSSHPGKGIKFYNAEFDANDSLIKYVHYKIVKSINTLCTIERAYINIQFKGMEGDFHIDDGDLTALLMITDPPLQGGEFEYYENNVIKQIPYKQNRLIIFSGIKHRGTCPKDNSPRITLAYKLNYMKK